MTKVDNLLDKADEMSARVEQLRAQEQAMHEVFPVRFSANMAAFERYIPSVFNRFFNYSIKRPFQIFCTDNGIPNLKWLDNDKILYGEDPYLECSEQVEHVLAASAIIRFQAKPDGDWLQQQHIKYMNEVLQLTNSVKSSSTLLENIPESMPSGFVFGIGLGYHLGYLYERCEIANLFVFEPDEDIFYASLYTFDWAPLLDYLNNQNMGLHLFIGDSDDNVITELREVAQKRAPFIFSTTFGMVHYQSPVLECLLSQIVRELSVLGNGWGFFDDNLFSLAQSLDNIESGAPFFRRDVLLPESFQSIPVFIIGNGPSLDSVVSIIRKAQKKALIIACGTAVTALKRAGIKPDVYIAVERTTAVFNSLSGLGDDAFLHDILCIVPDVLNPSCRRFFKDVIFAFKGDEPMYSLLFANTEYTERFRQWSFINPLVGNMGLSMPLHLGFNNVFLFGLDNGYRSSDHHHSKYSLYYDEDGKTKNEFKSMALAQGDSLLPGNFGGEIISNSLFSASVLMMEVALSYFPMAQCHNCSDGAAIRGATPTPPELLDFSLLPDLDKSEIRQFLLEDMAEKIPLTREEVESHLDVEFFSTLMERLKGEWQFMPSSRFELIQKMQKQIEYLNVVSMSQQRHIYLTLFGSFNTLFILITNLAYSIADEQSALSAVDTLRPTMIEFFETMEKLYPHALTFIQGQHQSQYQKILG